MEGNDGILFIIHVPEMIIAKQYEDYDHGFVEMNEYGISDISTEKEVLFNPLNIFKVLGVKEKNEKGKKWTEYHLEYGVIFDLILKKKENLLIYI